MISTAGGASSFEDLLIAAGYLDRLALAAGIGLAIAGWIPVAIPVTYLLAPAVAILTALARVRPDDWLAYLLAAPPMLPGPEPPGLGWASILDPPSCQPECGQDL